MFKYSVGVGGMMCGMCEAHVNDAVRQNFNVKKLKSSRKNNLTEFLSDQVISEDAIRDVISSTGYEFLSFDVKSV